jgi:hypothetical protein
MANTKRTRTGGWAPSTSDFTTQPTPRFTVHACRRGARRDLTLDALRYVMTNGREFHHTGVSFFALARRDIPPEDLRLPWVARLEGAVALASTDGAVITLYRDPTSFRAILRKAKYYAPCHHRSCDGRSLTSAGGAMPDDEERELA